MIIELRDVTIRYGALCAVSGVSLQARRGEVLGLLGPNGSGKSSLLRAIAGLVQFGGDIGFGAEIPPVIGFMPQDTSSSFALTVLETVLLGRLRHLALRVSPEDLEAVDAVLTRLGIAGLASRMIGDLSGGQRQLTFLAMALVAQPSVLLLDEPISALDMHHQLQVLETVGELTRDLGLITIVVMHDLTSAARHCDRIVILQNGTVAVAGSPHEAMKPDILSRVFQVDVECLKDSRNRTVIVPLASRTQESWKHWKC